MLMKPVNEMTQAESDEVRELAYAQGITRFWETFCNNCTHRQRRAVWERLTRNIMCHDCRRGIGKLKGGADMT
jgi:ribosomal protein S27E